MKKSWKTVKFPNYKILGIINFENKPISQISMIVQFEKLINYWNFEIWEIKNSLIIYNLKNYQKFWVFRKKKKKLKYKISNNLSFILFATSKYWSFYIWSFQNFDPLRWISVGKKKKKKQKWFKKRSVTGTKLVCFTRITIVKFEKLTNFQYFTNWKIIKYFECSKNC